MSLRYAPHMAEFYKAMDSGNYSKYIKATLLWRLLRWYFKGTGDYDAFLRCSCDLPAWRLAYNYSRSAFKHYIKRKI